MRELVYEVEFLSDIVLPASSNTQGKITQLDFIPGSAFLGIAAQKYGEFQNSFEIFHSGRVKFGDATILKDGKLTYKMPLSFFHEKLDDTTIYNHHKIEDFSRFDQLKQLRSGYITDDLEAVNIEYDYTQKSAYDKENRRSKKGQMYGYNAIKSGTKWQFRIIYDDFVSQEDIELLKETIEGEKRLGKSKSAQYGRVKITFLKEQKRAEKEKEGELVLYANSRLALMDEKGHPTYDPQYLFEGLSYENVDYAKTQIRTFNYTPYNATRATQDYERVCIDKGSVIVLKGVDATKIPNFVGAYQSEGFGEIVLNPKFLQHFSFSFKPSKDKKDETATIMPNSPLSLFLQEREREKQDRLDLGETVSEFIKDNFDLYKNIKPSQWGTIRGICIKGDENFKKQIEDYISSGKAKWEKRQIETLLGHSERLEFFKLLAMQMPKALKIKEQKERKNG